MVASIINADLASLPPLAGDHLPQLVDSMRRDPRPARTVSAILETMCQRGMRQAGKLMAAAAGTGRRARFAMPRFWRRYCQVTLGLYGLLWLALAVAPSDRAAWALEIALVVAFVPMLVASMR